MVEFWMQQRALRQCACWRLWCSCVCGCMVVFTAQLWSAERSFVVQPCVQLRVAQLRCGCRGMLDAVLLFCCAL